jgi:signal transduction histidine kinase/ActR/RegA family two-component response regulator
MEEIESRLHQQRAQQFSLITTASLGVFAVQNGSQGRLRSAAVLLVSALICGGVHLLLRSRKGENGMVRLMLLTADLGLAGNALYSGQGTSDALWFLVVVPMVAVFLLEGAEAVLWLAGTVALGGAVHLSGRWDPVTPEYLDQGFGLWLTQGALGLILLSFAYNSRRANERYLRMVLEREAHIRAQAAELEAAKNEALLATQSKSLFLAHMSHELRTPLNGVLGMASVLERTSLTPQQRDCVEVMRSSGESLLAQIGSVLDLSKAEAGRMELYPAPGSLIDCVESSLDAVTSVAYERGVELISLVDPELPEELVLDASRLRQVLINLLGNAAKFTEHGAVELRVEAAGELEPERVQLRFSVQDNGPGMSPELLQQLFTPYVQSRQVGQGAGLGLMISQNIVRLMGGQIEVRSEVGRGSEFSFVVALERPADRKAPESSVLEGLRVLMISRSARQREMIRLQVRRLGVEFEAADSLESVASNQADLFLLDPQESPLPSPFHLPPSLRGRLILLAHPGGGPPLDEELAGLPRVLKPSHLRSLAAALSSCARRSARLKKTRRTILPGDARILLVEDNRFNQRVALAMLRTIGLTADVAESGEAAVEKARSSEYDVILMDLNMPGIDGIEASRQILEFQRAPRPFLVALTADALESTRQRCFDAEFDEFITKPIQVESLERALHRRIARTIPPGPAGL